ncbi:hypothetical protein ACFL35_02255 [Candidatus Riflebacteria bacterium]
MKQAFFLGAGTSINYGVPLTRQFLPYMFENYLEDKRLIGLKNFLNDFYRQNFDMKPPVYPKFEQVLSFLDFAVTEEHSLSAKYDQKYLRQIRSDFDYLIWKMMEMATTESYFEGFQKFLQKTGEDSLFLSVNYDTLLDHTIVEQFGNISYGIGFSRIFSELQLQKDVPTPILLKLHGSINWLYCPVCESFYCYLGSIEMKKIFSTKPELCPYDNCYLKGVLISPTWHKNYNLSPISLMWIKASKFLRNIERITFIGYSLSDIDMRVNYLLKRSFFDNKNSLEIVVVDPDEKGTVFKRYERVFGKITGIKQSFEDYVNSF